MGPTSTFWCTAESLCMSVKVFAGIGSQNPFGIWGLITCQNVQSMFAAKPVRFKFTA